MARAGQAIRVLLAEDHAAVRQGLRMLLDAQPDITVVGEAEDGHIAVERARELKPDVVVMDVTMPVMNGLQATRAIKEAMADVHVISLTRHADDAYLQELLRAGVSGYVLKQSAATELLDAIRTVVAGHRHVDATLSRPASPSPLRRASSPPERPAITERESSVLRRVAWGHSNKEIAAELDLSVKTIEVHKANAMRKLSLRGRIDIVRYALLQGWLQDD
jgi:two-component system, NarL family, response regulator NreC